MSMNSNKSNPARCPVNSYLTYRVHRPAEMLANESPFYLAINNEVLKLQRLQKVLNAAARLIYQSPRHSHITPILISLHWLPVKFRVDFKIALLVYKALNGSAPISALLSPKSASKYDLRSDDQDLLQVPATKLKTVGDRAFTSAAPRIWNTLPLEIRQSENISIFKKQLKTFLFKNAFNI